MSWSKADVERLFRQTQRAVWVRCMRMLGDAAEAQDVMQEVYMALLENPSPFEGRATPVTYVFAIATKRCVGRLRKKYLRGAQWEQSVAVLCSMAVPAPDAGEAVEVAQWVRRALEDEDPVTAELVTYCFVDGLTQSEAAELVGLSRVTVNQRLQQFRQKLLESERAP